ncbi:hypothetical protein [Spiroplasma endosymbiont of Othius punctulatus]|uniref:hypothetical protein n=1 Tax=Spiroplasma endosymbiont of Othius punctulatus TaxID=3066289 RepID=UPI0030D3DDA3
MLRGITEDIDQSVNGFIENIFSMLNLGVVDSAFKIVMIVLSFLILAGTLFSLLIYKSFHRKGTRRFTYVMFYIWAFFAFIFSMLIFAINYNWFGIQTPVAIFIDPILGALTSMMSASGEVGSEFFNSFIGSIFGSETNLDNLSTESVIKFFLKVPTFIAWVCTIAIVVVTVLVNLAPKYKWIRETVKVSYFIGFFIMLGISVWAIAFTIGSDIKVGTTIEMLVKTQVKGITDGIIAGLDGVKDEADGMIEDIINKINCVNPEDTADLIIKLVDGKVIIGAGAIDGPILELDTSFLKVIFNVSDAEIKDYVESVRDGIKVLECDELKAKLEDAREWLKQV